MAGYSHVSLRLLPVTPHETRYDILGDTPMRRDLIRNLADTGMKVLDVESIRLDADAIPTDFLPLLEVAAMLAVLRTLDAVDGARDAAYSARAH